MAFLKFNWMKGKRTDDNDLLVPSVIFVETSVFTLFSLVSSNQSAICPRI